MQSKHSHYFKDVSHLSTIDVYRVLTLFNVTDPCVQHAAKKLLVAGGRGSKDTRKDIQEAIDSLERWKQIQAEDMPPIETVGGLPDIPTAEALMDSIDPVDSAFEWFDAARDAVSDEWAFKSIVRHLLKALEGKLDHGHREDSRHRCQGHRCVMLPPSKDPLSTETTERM